MIGCRLILAVCGDSLEPGLVSGKCREFNSFIEQIISNLKNRQGNLIGIRIEGQIGSEKVDGKPGRIMNSMQMENDLSNAPNQVCFYKGLLFNYYPIK